MISQKIIASGALVAAAFLFTAQTVRAENTKPSFVGDGVFSVCQDPTFPPMEFVQEGSDKAVGVDPDVVTALAKTWDVKPSIVKMDFNGLLPSLSAERCDAVISGAMLTEERQKTFDGVGYLNTYVIIIAKHGAAPLKDINDLAGKTIAVQSGTVYADKVEALNVELKSKGMNKINIQLYPKQTDAIQQLQIGRVDGVMTQDTEVAFREFQNPGQFSTIWTVPQEKSTPYAVYIRRNGNDKMALSKAVSAIVGNGMMGDIVKKWQLLPSQLDGIGK